MPSRHFLLFLHPTILQFTAAKIFLLFSAVDVDDLVLVDVLKDVRCVHQDADGADRGDDEEDVQLQPVHHHRHKLPIFTNLKRKR